MDYQKIYQLLIKKGKERRLIEEIYLEKHHIIPKCMNGTNDVENIVSLTPEEHYVAHQLLVKIYPNEGKLIQAMYLMTNNIGQRNNKAYGWIRRKNVDYLKNDIKRRKNLSEKLKGRKVSDFTKRKMSIAAKKRNASDSWKQKMRKAIIGKRYSDEVNKKKGRSGADNYMYGKTHTSEAKRIISEANKQKVICPHCNEQGGIAIMKRWHFDRCKSKE